MNQKKKLPKKTLSDDVLNIIKSKYNADANNVVIEKLLDEINKKKDKIEVLVKEIKSLSEDINKERSTVNLFSSLIDRDERILFYLTFKNDEYNIKYSEDFSFSDDRFKDVDDAHFGFLAKFV